MPCNPSDDNVVNVVIRFEEKCWSVESEECKTVYDTVIDKKCESVSLTVPQKECDTTEEMVMEKECKVVNETVITPICIDTMENVVEEVSKETISPIHHNHNSPSNVHLEDMKSVSNNHAEMCQNQLILKHVRRLLMKSVRLL